MFHSIITILTTAAVALHAMLGCCAHHDHSCQSHESGLAVVVQDADDHSSHGHHHHDEEKSSGEDVGNDCGHQHDGGGHHDDCDEGECSFTSVRRSNDLELMLTFSMWCQALSDSAHADALDSLLSLHSVVESPPDPLSKSGSARAKSQVWRL